MEISSDPPYKPAVQASFTNGLLGHVRDLQGTLTKVVDNSTLTSYFVHGLRLLTWGSILIPHSSLTIIALRSPSRLPIRNTLCLIGSHDTLCFQTDGVFQLSLAVMKFGVDEHRREGIKQYSRFKTHRSGFLAIRRRALAWLERTSDSLRSSCFLFHSTERCQLIVLHLSERVGNICEHAAAQ